MYNIHYSPSSALLLCVYTRYNLFAHSSLHIPAYIIISPQYTVLHILLFIFSYYYYNFFFTYICIYSRVVLHILHCPLSGPDLIYISLLIILCIIEYMTNKKTLNLVCFFCEFRGTLSKLLHSSVVLGGIKQGEFIFIFVGWLCPHNANTHLYKSKFCTQYPFKGAVAQELPVHHWLLKLRI